MQPESLMIDNVKYVREDRIPIAPVIDLTKGKIFCIIRTYSAGVFAGYVAKEDLSKLGKIELTNSIRLWQWFGASLSQLSQEGTPDASKCKFAMTELSKFVEPIEVTPCTEKARINLQAVKQWKL